MLIKTLFLFVMTFAISTASLVNIVSDIFGAEVKADEVQTENRAQTLEYPLGELVKPEPDSNMFIAEDLLPLDTVEKTSVIEEPVQPATEPVEEVLATEATEPLNESFDEMIEDYEEEEYIEETLPDETVADLPYWEYYHYAPLEHNGEGYITDGPAGPNGNDGYETWYDLDMTTIVEWLDEYFEQKGIEDGCDYSHYEYWVDERGVKMYGPYIMVAGDIVNTRQRYDIVECSLGTAIVADYCEEAVFNNPYQLDIATDWWHRKRVK